LVYNSLKNGCCDSSLTQLGLSKSHHVIFLKNYNATIKALIMFIHARTIRVFQLIVSFCESLLLTVVILFKFQCLQKNYWYALNQVFWRIVNDVSHVISPRNTYIHNITPVSSRVSLWGGQRSLPSSCYDQSQSQKYFIQFRYGYILLWTSGYNTICTQKTTERVIVP
jgi:hypothetical protein